METAERERLLARFESEVLDPLAGAFAEHAVWLQALPIAEFARAALAVCDQANDRFIQLTGAASADDIDEVLGTLGMLLIITRLNKALPVGCRYCICALEIRDEGPYYKYSVLRHDIAPGIAAAIVNGDIPIVQADTGAVIYNTAFKAARLRDLPKTSNTN